MQSKVFLTLADDIGCLGLEIRTPNLDTMAQNGTPLCDMRSRYQKLENQLIARHDAWCNEAGICDWTELEQAFLIYYNMTRQH